jgi:hypothetical protein
MLEDGIYGLAYAAGRGRMPGEGSALAMLRGGRILGSDPWGGVFTGSCRFDAGRRLTTIDLRLEVPPNGELITGFSAGPAGASIDIVAAFEGAAPKLSSIIDVAGRQVRVELTYLGPLPA